MQTFMINKIKAVFVFISLLVVFEATAQQSVLIVYHSETGYTEQMAAAVAEGAATINGIEVILLSVKEVQENDLLEASAIIVGSPVHNANVSSEISAFIASWPYEEEPLKDKMGAAFVTAGGFSAGEEVVQLSILKSMLVFGMIVVGGPDWTQPFGASAITGEDPFEISETGLVDAQFLDKGRALGKRVAYLVNKLQ